MAYLTERSPMVSRPTFPDRPTFSATKFFNPDGTCDHRQRRDSLCQGRSGAGASLCARPGRYPAGRSSDITGNFRYAVIFDESVVGGQPTMTVVTRPAGFDFDNDGIPNTWETAHGLNPNLATDANKLNPIGYALYRAIHQRDCRNRASQTWNSNGGNWVTVRQIGRAAMPTSTT